MHVFFCLQLFFCFYSILQSYFCILYYVTIFCEGIIPILSQQMIKIFSTCSRFGPNQEHGRAKEGCPPSNFYDESKKKIQKN